MKRVYSFPRRFDLTTMLVAVALWAGVLALCRILTFPWQATAFISFLLLVVALAQFLLSPLNRPRTVSVVAGVVYAVVGESVLYGFITGRTVFLMMMMGAFLGYVAGVCIAAAPLISDLLHTAVRRDSSRDNSTESD